MIFCPSLAELSIGRIYADSGVSRVFFSFEDIESWALTLNREVELSARYSGIFAVARGGLYLGSMLSHFSGLPMRVLHYKRSSAKVTIDSHLFEPGARVLMVEDIAGSGVTLANCKSALEKQGFVVDVAVVAFDAMSREKPAFGLNCAGYRVVFPWERGLVGKKEITDSQGEYLDPWLVGFDMDGVFLPDVPGELYASNLARALEERKNLVPFGYKPKQWQGENRHPVITGRLVSEKQETLQWLKDFGLNPSELHMRPDLSICPAEFKALKIREIGVTEFVESELWQARLIVKSVPHCVVWHYDASTQALTRVSAA